MPPLWLPKDPGSFPLVAQPLWWNKHPAVWLVDLEGTCPCKGEKRVSNPMHQQ